jgi:chemotaxis protein MotB
MTLARERRRVRGIDYWPGFVDALSALLLGLIFVFLVFLLAQVVLARDPSVKDAALQRLDLEVAELSSKLGSERAAAEARLSAERTSLLSRVAAAEKASAETAERASATFLAMEKELAEEKAVASAARAEVEAASREIAALKLGAASFEAMTAGMESRQKAAEAKIADLGARLAAAETSARLDHYRSEFFARLGAVLGARQGIRVAGDRFVVQSEVLFASGRARLDPAGRAELDKIAAALIELESLIPKDIAWVLRVDGHTDTKPIVSRGFASNWALSSARATEVVQFLIKKGVPPQRLAAAGFGEFHPIDLAGGEEADQRNRRIELKITEK